MSGKDKCWQFSRNKKQNPPRSLKVRLQFPISQVLRPLQEGQSSCRLGSPTPEFLAGVLENLTTNILELVGMEAYNNQRIHITPEHVERALDRNHQPNYLCDDDNTAYIKMFQPRKK